ncbi:MAG TPA: type II toxin-antitoxin system prevent-host-death family antitoxin [Gammaproteobacteria bacterium]|nr:type II toxin-antitoxin system prevent-host-death family antitoxin [Gammaproteobacteria bacterium]
MDDTVSAREANQHFSKLLRRVQGGERIVVTSRGRPVAQVSAIVDAPNARLEARKKAFIKQLRRRPATPIAGWSRDELYD